MYTVILSKKGFGGKKEKYNINYNNKITDGEEILEFSSVNGAIAYTYTEEARELAKKEDGTLEVDEIR